MTLDASMLIVWACALLLTAFPRLRLDFFRASHREMRYGVRLMSGLVDVRLRLKDRSVQPIRVVTFPKADVESFGPTIPSKIIPFPLVSRVRSGCTHGYDCHLLNLS
jgi:hypothetical protein